jgi:hypothetical protein
LGSVIMHDQSLINSLPTDALSSGGGVNGDAGTNLMQNGEESPAIRPLFMQPGRDNSSTGPGADPPEPHTDAAGESASGDVAQAISPGSAAHQLSGAGSSAPPSASPPHTSPAAAAHGDPPTGGSRWRSCAGSSAPQDGSGVAAAPDPSSASSQLGDVAHQPAT